MSARAVLVVSSAFMLSGCIAALPIAAAMGSGGAGLGFGALVGRSDAKANAPRVTAQAIGNNMDPAVVQIQEFKVKTHTATWMADTPSGRYSCSADDGVKSAYCVKK